jgi:hypothetical protein
LKPLSRTSDSRIEAKRVSSSTISTTASPGSICSRSSTTRRVRPSGLLVDRRKVWTGEVAGRSGWLGWGWAAGLKFSGR